MELYNKAITGIKNADDIEGAFKSDYGYDLFEQNTTEYLVEESTVIKTEDGHYYAVTVEVTSVGAWQDVGDKLYTIETIDTVTHKEVFYSDLVKTLNNGIENAINQHKQAIVTLESQKIKETNEKI